MDLNGRIDITDLKSYKNVYVLVNKSYIRKDVSDLFSRAKYILLEVNEYLKNVSSSVDPNFPVVGFKIHKSYIMWTRFPIIPNEYWSYFYGLVLGSSIRLERRNITQPIKILIEPQVLRFLKKYVFRQLGITYGIEKRELGRVRVIIHAAPSLILSLWRIQERKIQPFLDTYKVVEGYLNSNKFIVQEPQKATGFIRSESKELLSQISEYFNKLKISHTIKDCEIQIFGSKNLQRIYNKFIIILPKVASRLFFVKECTKRRFLRKITKILSKNDREILYFIAWKNQTSIRTIARYLHMDIDTAYQIALHLEKLGFCQILKGDFGDIVVYTPNNAKGLIAEFIRSRIEKLKEIIDSRSLEYYYCPSCNEYYSFSRATNLNFKCEICNKPLIRKEVTPGFYKSLRGIIGRLENTLREI
ncbi:MAG: hypothetical protein ABGF52_10375 [Candidatus Asgardarchaeum sp.]